MNMKTFLFASALTGMTVFAGCNYLENEEANSVPKEDPFSSGIEYSQSTSPEKDMKKQSSNSGKMLPYSPENLNNSLANGDTVVLAFAADWCPSCQAVEKDIMKNITNIPTGITLIRANFDTESELKDRYNVKGQHTFVQLDSNKNAVKTWRGSSTLKDLLSQIQ